MRRFAAPFWLLLMMVISALPSLAAEQITSYRSEIKVARDGTITVTEMIRANAEGQAIRRGIYRDIPLTLDAGGGSVINVDFNLLSVRRDGRDEPYHTENIENGVRVYIGDADTLLEHGEHTFEITYETNRQIRFLETHDELYWNAIGNQWAFPVLEGSARVTVPTGVDIQDTAFFTGFQGATGKDARVARGASVAVFNLTRRLEAGEGLTIAVKMPKGSIDRPTAAEERMWWLKDNLGLLLAGGGLLLVFGYYSLAWRHVGRDPEKGVLVPRWDAPEGISPALVNYIDNRGFSDGGWTALSAAALNLAIKGHVVLEDLKSSLVIRATEDASASGLPTGESRLLRSVQSNGGTLTIDKAHGTTVRTAGADFRSAMEKEHRGKYYLANRAYIVLGIVVSVAVLIAIFAFGSIDEETAALIIVPVFISFFLGTSVIGIGRTIFRARNLAGRIAAVVMLAFFSFVALTVLGGFLLFAYQSMDTIRQMPLLAAIGAIVLVNAIFFFLMGAPTPIGRKMMDGIDGLRQYLTLAEKDRMNMAGAPQMSPEHFETLLPYAVALGVEKPWSRTFETWLAAAAAGAAAAYTPAWYAGDAFHSGSFGDRMGGFTGSMASTMSSSLPAPPSSSSSGFSSGGGSSGGGGGGGGGGGW